MAENVQIQDPEKVKAAEENERFKKRLKEEYGIEDEPDTFKEKRTRWQAAEEDVPKYQATLDRLIDHFRTISEPKQDEPPVRQVDEDAEEQKLRTIAKLDPYEGTKRMLQKWEQTLDKKLEGLREESRTVAQGATIQRETMRRSRDIVEQNWPEAFDEKSELFKMGSRIYNQEMSDWEKRDPRSFLIATERAAGRLGIPPKSRRGSSTRRSEVAAQNVSRQAAPRPDDDENDAPLTPRQKKIIEGLGVDEKTYRLAQKNRKAQKKAAEESE